LIIGPLLSAARGLSMLGDQARRREAAM